MTHETSRNAPPFDASIAHGVYARQSLAVAEIAPLRALIDEVQVSDGLPFKIDRDLSASEPWPHSDEPIDFCYFEHGRLVGYAALDVDGVELEVTAIVSPGFRRRGIFRTLLDRVRVEGRRRGATKLLLVSYRASESGTAAVQAMRLPYVFSEYRMEAGLGSASPVSPGTIQLARVAEADLPELAYLSTLCFGSDRRTPEAWAEQLRRPDVRYYLAENDGVRIGQIGVITMDDGVYVRGFGILPAYRRRGFGRQLLAAALHLMQTEGHTRFMLDVATDNAGALTLYESCGFHTTNIYDYHGVPLPDSAGGVKTR